MMLVCFLYQFIMDFHTQVNKDLPTISNIEVAKDENMEADSLEVVNTLLPISDLLQDTDGSKDMISNVDQTVSAEDISDTIAIDSSKTRECPDVSLDNVSSEENLEEMIQLSRESPEALSDNESERVVENEDAICNPKQVQDAFVFCPILKSIESGQYYGTGKLSK